MRLKEHLLQLPLRFDAAGLAADVAALPPRAWVPHPNKLPGNAAALLVTTNGEMNDDIAAPMAPTEFLKACPHIMAAMATINATWGRSRLMRLAPGATVPPHIDTNFYWRTHVRLHIPIVTTPEVLFTCEGRSVHMAAGECWIFDTFSRHRVENAGAHSRTHLVLDTVGGEGLIDLIEAARGGGSIRDVSPPGPGSLPSLSFEQSPTKTIMSPWELRYHTAFVEESALPDPALAPVTKRLERMVATWAGLWASHGSTLAGVPHYHRVLESVSGDLTRLRADHLRLRNNLPLYEHVSELLSTVAATLDDAEPAQTQRRVVR